MKNKKRISITIRALTLAAVILTAFVVFPGFHAEMEGAENSEGTITVYCWDRLREEAQLNTVKLDSNWHSTTYGILPVYKIDDLPDPYTFRTTWWGAESVGANGNIKKICYNSYDDNSKKAREGFCTVEKIESYSLKTTKTHNQWGAGLAFFEYQLLDNSGDFVYSKNYVDSYYQPFYTYESFSQDKASGKDTRMLVFGHKEYWYSQNIGGKVKMRPYEFCFCFKTRDNALAFGINNTGVKVFAPLPFKDMHLESEYCMSARTWYCKEETWKTYGGSGERYVVKDNDVFIIPDGSIILEGTEFIIEPGAVVSVEGRLINNGTVYNYGNLVLQEGASVISADYDSSGSGSVYCRGSDYSYTKETLVSDGKGGTKTKTVTLKGEGCLIVKSGAKLALHDENASLKLEKGTTCYNAGYMLIPGGIYMKSASFTNDGVCVMGYKEIYEGNFTSKEIPWTEDNSSPYTAKETDPYLSIVPISFSDYNKTENFVKKGENWYDFTRTKNADKTVFEN